MSAVIRTRVLYIWLLGEGRLSSDNMTDYPTLLTISN